MTLKDKLSIFISLALGLVFMYGFINLAIREEPTWGEYHIKDYECSERKRDYFHNLSFIDRSSLHAFSEIACLNESEKIKIQSSKKVKVLHDETTFYQLENKGKVYFEKQENKSSIKQSMAWAFIMGSFMIFIAILRYIKVKNRLKINKRGR